MCKYLCVLSWQDRAGENIDFSWRFLASFLVFTSKSKVDLVLSII